MTCSHRRLLVSPLDRRFEGMCLGIPGQVVEMVEGYGDQLALIDVLGARNRVNIGMLELDRAESRSR
ncbi:MAG: HypC/HybG/HupF family hydrogenase formation chaperone [Nocardioidaceae bacterium]